ncbi:carbonic anhydrase [Rossellomorea marisflavi]|uniref:beta-class carbonic anhydrase n=1 Tax=Rossellomorea marisflavi TaxID=189381 RepID=UPI0006F91120|nr:carbonic anhydrase [Rossellomorea marisflavi]KQU63014.1 carbonic anhydrase [Bacillus sp. Leaf406]MDW4525135.1 carbonic anhydrase [Rossellomorea marisflavi]
MTLLNTILDYNEQFVEEKAYEQYRTTKFPDKRLVILTCMDTRLVELLPKSMNIKNGDVKIVKNAGAILTHPFGSIMRSLLVAVYELQADEVIVIGHHDCGMSAIDSHKMVDKMKERGVSEDTLGTLNYSGIDLHDWLKGFDSVQESVAHSVDMIKNHPLMDKKTPVHGLVIDPATGKLDLVVDGY